ncbi:hypothetical protein J4467_00980 [Candidatus Woesearchaeota archaeon]|nr:hypothetical protein [Candidatus Woesearchaeota archaeon]
MKRIMLVIGVLSLLLVSACSTQESSEVTLSEDQITDLCASVNTVDESSTGVGEGVARAPLKMKIRSTTESCVCWTYDEVTECNPTGCG